jgi:hypothetical protein
MEYAMASLPRRMHMFTDVNAGRHAPTHPHYFIVRACVRARVCACVGRDELPTEMQYIIYLRLQNLCNENHVTNVSAR